jgi:hypothetical protein
MIPDGILMIGPVPPPYGGQSILVQNILRSRIASRFQFRLLPSQDHGIGKPGQDSEGILF